MKEEVETDEIQKEKLREYGQKIKEEYESNTQNLIGEVKKFNDLINQLKKENGRLCDEKSEKDFLLKELTSKNLELLAKIGNLESSIKPYYEDVKQEIYELRAENKLNQQ